MQFGECQICYNQIENAARFGTCGHTFCVSCSVIWAKKLLQCPTCRCEPPFFSVFINSTPKPSVINSEKKTCSAKSKINNKDQKITKNNNKICSKTKDSKHEKSEISILKLTPSEFISNYDKDTWEFEKASSTVKIRLDSQRDLSEPENQIGLSHFQENLSIMLQTTSKLRQTLQKYRHYVFYSEMDEIINDVSYHCELHMDSTKSDQAHPENEISAFLATFFQFLNQLNGALLNRDFENLNCLLTQVDDMYYDGYLPYNYRGYDEDYPCDEFEEDFDDQNFPGEYWAVN